MMKLIKRAKWVCQEFRYDIIKDAYEQLIQIKKRNVKQNYKDFKKI